MRQGQSSKRSRGRSGGGRRNGSPRHQSFDSNGPSIRIRGNANQVYEKYIQLARDANSAGDRITAENMYQHAEHYFRLMNVDDGQQNRGNGADNRHQQRNTQPEQEHSPAAAEAGTPSEPAATESSESSSRLNGSEDKGRRPRSNSAAGDADGDAEKPSEAATERAPRRPRRSPSRSRAKPAAETAPASEAPEAPAPVVVETPAPVMVEAEAVTDPVPTEVEAKDAP